MQPTRSGTLNRFFSGLAEQTFQTQLGVADPPLIDYLSDLLARFIRFDSVYRVRDPRGRRLALVAEMLAEAENRVGAARREVHRHIGDFTLFWIGVYPESIGGRSEDSPENRIIDYQEEGKRSYWIASTIEVDSQKRIASNDVLERLSRNFELCAYGLREVRREWERRDDDDRPAHPILIN